MTTSRVRTAFVVVLALKLTLSTEPLRRSDLMNSINKLAGERKMALARSRVQHRSSFPMQALLREFR